VTRRFASSNGGLAPSCSRAGTAATGTCSTSSPPATGRSASSPTPRVATANTHGTGCTLSAAITAEVAVLGRERAAVGSDLLGEAVGNALDYLARALKSAADWQVSLDPEGAHGPVDHQVDIVRGRPA
jgi:hydroxymethylpyrimidine/phosphomethylpyrimidine kinase